MKVYLSATMPDLLLIYGYGDEGGGVWEGVPEPSYMVQITSKPSWRLCGRYNFNMG